jgi:uncharacterized protein (UPF0332 family)
MEGKDFLEVANRLFKSAHEADRRTSVSRSYYAVFNHVKTAFESFNVTLSSDASAHQKICHYLRNSGLDEAEDLAQVISDLRIKRGDADYDMKASGFDNKNCLLWYKKAELCIDSFNGVDKKELRKGIIEYKRSIND